MLVSRGSFPSWSSSVLWPLSVACTHWYAVGSIMGEATPEPEPLRCHRRYLCEETLRTYDVPFVLDPSDPDVFLIKCEMDERYGRMLLKHSLKIRERKAFIESRTQSTPPLSINFEGRPRWSPVARERQSRRSNTVEPIARTPVRPGLERNKSSSMWAQSSKSSRESQQTSNPSPPMFPKVHRDYVHEKTLRYFDIPYKWHPEEPGYFVLLQEMTQEELEALFEHTYSLRASTEGDTVSSPGPLVRIDSPMQDQEGREGAGREQLVLLDEMLKQSIVPVCRCFKFMAPEDDSAREMTRKWLQQMVREIEKTAGATVEDVESEQMKTALSRDCRTLLCELECLA